MKFHGAWIASVAGLLSLAGSLPASATELYTLSISGAVTDNNAGNPGQLNSGFSNVKIGDQYTFTMEYDPTLGVIATAGGVTRLLGGSVEGYSDPVVSDFLRIDGYTDQQNLGYDDIVGYIAAGGGASYFGVALMQPTTTILFQAGSSSDALSASFTTPFSYVPSPLFSSQLYLTSDSSSQIDFSITNISIAAATVPEPATWAMVLVGFGGIGFALRNRRKAIATA